MKEISFRKQGFSVRSILKEDGSIWFVAKDVCGELGLTNSRKATSALDTDELTSLKVTSGRQKRNMTFINESGFYALVMRSNKPRAREFRKWVTSEVLPEIRKTGGYASPEEVAKLKDVIKQFVQEKGMTAQEWASVFLKDFTESNLNTMRGKLGQLTIYRGCISHENGHNLYPPHLLRRVASELNYKHVTEREVSFTDDNKLYVMVRVEGDSEIKKAFHLSESKGATVNELMSQWVNKSLTEAA